MRCAVIIIPETLIENGCKVVKKLPFLIAVPTTGMDALTHAVEVYLGGPTTRDTRKDALLAVRLIFRNPDKVYNDGTDLDARRKMLTASFHAGGAGIYN